MLCVSSLRLKKTIPKNTSKRDMVLCSYTIGIIYLMHQIKCDISRTTGDEEQWCCNVTFFMLRAFILLHTIFFFQR